MRVFLASERPQLQNLLMDVVEEVPGAIVIGQAENATKALTLMKKLRPDVAIIDSNLPYSVGLDMVVLSRVSGLDTAQTISEMLPTTRVVVITNLDTQVFPVQGLSEDTKVFLSRERLGGNTALKLEELRRKARAPNTLVFANVELQPRPAFKPHGEQRANDAIFFGGLGILGGGYLIGTMILAPVGVFLVLAGATIALLGLGRRLSARFWRK